VTEHFFLSCDRDFTQIEKHKKFEKCEVPMDLLNLIVNTTSNNPFTATLLQPNYFYDFKNAADMYINTGYLQISKCYWLKIKKDEPVVLQMKAIFNLLEACKTCKVLKKGVKINAIQEMDFPSLVCENIKCRLKKKGSSVNATISKKRK